MLEPAERTFAPRPRRRCAAGAGAWSTRSCEPWRWSCSSRRRGDRPAPREAVVPYLLLVAVTFGLSLFPKAWYRLRVIWLLFAVAVAGLLNLAVHGLTPNSYTAFAAATVIATILIGWKCGIIVASAITVALGGIA